MPNSRRHHAGERQHRPETQAMLRAQQRIGIGADGVESDVTEIEQAREADHDVEAPAQHHVGQDQHAEIHRLLVGKRRERHHDRHAASSTQPNHLVPIWSMHAAESACGAAACTALVGPGPDGADHQQHAAQRHEPVQEARRQLASARRRPRSSRCPAQSPATAGPCAASDRPRRPTKITTTATREVDEVIVEAEPGARADIDGAEANDEDAESGCDEGGKARVLQHLGQTRTPCVQTFSISGLPEQSGRPEDQHQDEDRERRNVLVLAREIARPRRPRSGR